MTPAAAPEVVPHGPRARRGVVARALDAVDAVVDYRPWVPLRIAGGVLAVIHLLPFLADASSGVIYRDRFWVPYAVAMPELPRSLYVAALWVGAAGGVLLAIGLFTRVASVATAAVVVYNLALSQTHYHHNRAFLAILLVALTLVPVGGAGSLDAHRTRRAGRSPTTSGRAWPLLALRFQIAAVYVASGVSKLLDPDWFGGVVTRLRLERWLDAGGAAGIPGVLLDAIRSPAFHGVAAPLIVATEVFIGFGLLFPRTRASAIWTAVAFHVAIELSADVQLFSWAALAALVVWVRPTPPDRVLHIGDHGRWGRAVAMLDWTGRFRVRPGGSGVALRDVDGAVYRGREALIRALRLFPLTFPIAWPFSLGAVPLRPVDPVHSVAVARDRRPG